MRACRDRRGHGRGQPRRIDVSAVALEQAACGRSSSRGGQRRRGDGRGGRHARRTTRASIREAGRAPRSDGVGERLGLTDEAALASSRSPRGCTTSARSACRMRCCSRTVRWRAAEWEIMRRHPEWGAQLLGRGAGAEARRADRASRPRALGRRRLSRPAATRRHTAREPDHLRVRRVSRDDVGPALSGCAAALDRGQRVARGSRRPVRPGRRGRARQRAARGALRVHQPVPGGESAFRPESPARPARRACAGGCAAGAARPARPPACSRPERSAPPARAGGTCGRARAAPRAWGPAAGPTTAPRASGCAPWRAGACRSARRRSRSPRRRGRSRRRRAARPCAAWRLACARITRRPPRSTASTRAVLPHEGNSTSTV